MIEVHEASSSDDDSDDNVPLSELAEGPSKETSCSHGKKLTKAQEHAKKYQWKKSDSVPENTFDGTFSDPPEEVYSPLTYFKHFIDDDCIRHCTEQTNIYAMQKDGKECAISADEMERFFSIQHSSRHGHICMPLIPDVLGE